MTVLELLIIDGFCTIAILIIVQELVKLDNNGHVDCKNKKFSSLKLA